VKWNLRWAAAKRDIWRPSDLLVVFKEVGFEPSLSKVAALWGGKPVTVRLDDLDMICTALHCTVADLLEAEPVSVAEADTQLRAAAGANEFSGAARPTPRRGGGRGSPPCAACSAR
jgi:DNA-binding Xre family transcriptional regulator